MLRSIVRRRSRCDPSFHRGDSEIIARGQRGGHSAGIGILGAVRGASQTPSATIRSPSSSASPIRPKAVPVRLHSACLTGDVFGSRRCDCGDQLQLALARIESLGGGVILYLAQEGRGIGLANKMRAYRCRMAGSIRATPTPRSASRTTSAITASPR